MIKAIAVSGALAALTACGGGGAGAVSGLPAVSGAQPAAGSSVTLPPASGTVASGYIECDTDQDVAAGNDCNGFANFAPATGGAFGGTFTFTVVAATASGAIIAQQQSGGTPLAFPNGAYEVVESASDVPAVVSIAGGPWSTPGSALSGPAGSYGNHVALACIHTGVARLELRLVTPAGSVPLPFATGALPASIATLNCSASGSVSVI